ncbi:type VII secretion-associated protein [Nocardia caishijiensis]|uniref:Type VII secretion-associated protein (TIGR03931 family) n=1 Tax=Nocardia caishijiensis TaxID=184756 RepID=A0ABQ6YSB8_9NOCA|nr:type VII secretion-associated protein [Nocardia caishijiensis]KAF0848326.1 type VII secretion-associated protein (TIGR03931 family) [Nocardia caishijiensis]
MTVVELVVSEAKVWARGDTTHWDVVPSIVLGSNNSDLVVGEPLTPPTQVVSAVQYLTCDRIALPPRMPSAVQGLSAVLAAIVDALRIPAACERFVVVHPTAWGQRTLDLFAAAAGQFAHEVVFESCAVHASAVDPAARRSRRTAVIEFGLLSTTAATVGYDVNGTHVEAVDAEPNLAAAELDSDEGRHRLDELLTRLLADRPVDVVQVVGATGPSVRDAVAEAVERICGAKVPLSHLTGADLARPIPTGPTYTPRIPPDPAAEWMQPLRARAAATNPVDRRPLYLGAAALAAVIAAASIGGFFFLGGSTDQQAAASGPTTTTVVSSSPQAPPRPTTTTKAPTPVTEQLGRVELMIPVGWHRTPATDPTRADLTPGSGPRQRITVIQEALTAGAGYDEVAADLEALIKKKPAGTVSEIRRDVVFAGRPGLSYEERPADGSTVRWQVLVERGVQVSVGCQYGQGGWEGVLPACEQVVGALRVQQ